MLITATENIFIETGTHDRSRRCGLFYGISSSEQIIWYSHSSSVVFVSELHKSFNRVSNTGHYFFYCDLRFCNLSSKQTAVVLVPILYRVYLLNYRTHNHRDSNSEHVRFDAKWFIRSRAISKHPPSPPPPTHTHTHARTRAHTRTISVLHVKHTHMHICV
jgi:hypothetical protein